VPKSLVAAQEAEFQAALVASVRKAEERKAAEAEADTALLRSRRVIKVPLFSPTEAERGRTLEARKHSRFR
jgi:hypothetical protein